MNEEDEAFGVVLRRKWDTAGGALLGAYLGAIVQGSHEFQHNFIAPSGVQDPMAFSFVALVLAALAVSVLFTALTVLHNLVLTRLGRKKPVTMLSYCRSDFAFAGAVLGILLVLAHEAFNFLSGRWQTDFLGSTDPFTHIVLELIIVALGGELLFRAVVKIRNWDAA